MIVKIIFGKNRNEIEEKVSQELGPEAIILTITRIKDDEYEAKVGIEEADLAVHQHHVLSNDSFDCSEELGLDNSFKLDEDEEEFWNMATVPDCGRQQKELFSPKNVLSECQSSCNSGIEGELQSIAQYLEGQGVMRKLALVICKQLGEKHPDIDLTVDDNKKTEALKSLYSIISSFSPTISSDVAAKVFSFVGKPAVGKTTTLLKLACNSKYQGNKVLVIILEHDKPWEIKASLTLARYFGVEVITAKNAYEVKNIIESRGGDVDKFFIDTYGNPTHLYGVDKQHQFIVVSAATDELDSLKEIAFFKTDTPQSLIITKVDQVKTLGFMLNLVVHGQLPISYLCDGSRIPKDLCKVHSEMIVNLVLSIGKEQVLDVTH